jgi:FlaA1/EpsC-like NDP-sugar epimerase
LLEQCEYHLYEIEKQLRDAGHHNILALLGDVKDQLAMEHIFQRYSPHVVFHAAAYKHVPMLESNPVEGVLNNIFGTKIVADLADQYACEKFVLVSTDKAVNPSSIMGVSKRVAEIYCRHLNDRSESAFIVTRFGNVLGSTGSVVPRFQEQIDKGGPLTVTHPNVVRFFMTISEAVGLIIQAGAMGQGGEIFVLDMGEPLRIKHLAEQMVRLSGLEIDKDIEIRYTGLRPGEKLYEELFHENEDLRVTEHTKLLLADSREVDSKWLEEKMTALLEQTLGGDRLALTLGLQSIVPEFHPFVNAQEQGNAQRTEQASASIISFPKIAKRHEG